MSRRVTAVIMWLALAGLCAVVLSLAGVFLYLDPQVPKAEEYRHVRLETPLRVYSTDERLIAEFGERRLIPVTLDEVPDLFVSALLDTEDKRFFEHHGVDFITLATSAVELVINLGEITRGGSTITMQLPRNLGTFSLDQLFIRKFKEVLLALKMERELSKNEILELYINAVPFGKRAYGVQAASLTYYGTPLSNLTLPQLAMLAGIPQAPSAGNPINGPERALRRRNVVLGRMLDQESITVEQYEDALAAPITARLHARALDVAAPFASEWVRQQLLGTLPDLYTGGYQVYTTIRSDFQRAADSALRTGLLSYDRRHGYRGPEARLEFDQEQGLTPEDISNALKAVIPHSGLLPGVVSGVDELSATVVLAVGNDAQLNLESVRWAREFIDVDIRGPRVDKVGDVLSVGDLVRVEYLGKLLPPESDLEKDVSDDETQPDEAAEGEQPPEPVDTWRLAQLPEIQGAVVSLEPQTGAVLALSGGFDFAMNQYNHALQAARQPGSGFKPFVYSAALNSGVTPASIFMDAPLVFDDTNLESEYRPDNDNNRYNGPTRLREGLYRSINLVSMRVLLEVGAGQVMDYVSRFGFDTTTFPRNTQLAIGGGTMAVTPVDMARAYSVFANGGWLIEPNIVDRVMDINGEQIFKARHPIVCADCADDAESSISPLQMAEPANLEELLAGRDPDIVDADVAESTVLLPPLYAERVVDERNAYIMHTMLQDVIKRGTGRRAIRDWRRGDIAGKTGTTNEAADTWFNGYNPEVATTVWVGFPNHRPLGANEWGSNTPLPIWTEYMRTALEGTSEIYPDQPTGVVTRKIDPKTGELATAANSEAIFEFFLKEYLPSQTVADRIARPEDDTEIKPVDIF